MIVTDFTDGWTRTFGKVPELSRDETDFLREYLHEGHLSEIIIYLEKYRGITGDDAEFLLRELMRNDIG